MEMRNSWTMIPDWTWVSKTLEDIQSSCQHYVVFVQTNPQGLTSFTDLVNENSMKCTHLSTRKAMDKSIRGLQWVHSRTPMLQVSTLIYSTSRTNMPSSPSLRSFNQISSYQTLKRYQNTRMNSNASSLHSNVINSQDQPAIITKSTYMNAHSARLALTSSVLLEFHLFCKVRRDKSAPQG
jgi:hypothetical protein